MKGRWINWIWKRVCLDWKSWKIYCILFRKCCWTKKTFVSAKLLFLPCMNLRIKIYMFCFYILNSSVPYCSSVRLWSKKQTDRKNETQYTSEGNWGKYWNPGSLLTKAVAHYLLEKYLKALDFSFLSFICNKLSTRLRKTRFFFFLFNWRSTAYFYANSSRVARLEQTSTTVWACLIIF